MVNKVALILLYPVLLFLAGNLYSQVPVNVFAQLETKVPGQGTIHIKQSTEITNMLNLHIAQMRNLKGIKGFRVCIYYNSGQEARAKADQERARFMSRYEDVMSDKVWESPFWKVYAGNFRNKSEALKFLERIRYDYPNAFIRENIIVAFPE